MTTVLGYTILALLLGGGLVISILTQVPPAYAG
jgi:hypothetical protein